jgi:hypothetical protein
MIDRRYGPSFNRFEVPAVLGLVVVGMVVCWVGMPVYDAGTGVWTIAVSLAPYVCLVVGAGMSATTVTSGGLTLGYPVPEEIHPVAGCAGHPRGSPFSGHQVRSWRRTHTQSCRVPPQWPALLSTPDA